MSLEVPGTLVRMAGEEPYLLRLPPDLKAWLTEQAKQNRRSLNSEIVFRLEQLRRAEARTE